MDVLCGKARRGEAIDQARQDILNRTTLTFLPRRQVHFLDDYANLPGSESMPIWDRFKLIPDNYRRKFLKRVETVVRHSRQAEIDQVSEFNWEADAWRDIFGRLRDDDRLRMDKREYNYKATVLDPQHMKNGQDAYMGKRIPDITFGLSSYFCADPEDEGVDGRERRIRRSLQKTSLISSIWAFDEPSLIADGKWGGHTILFPFAVYEAKKDRNSETEVKVQLKLAFNTYLQMLDKLVRQPGMTDKYQSPRVPVFPMFGLTSSGSTWRMYVAYLPHCFKGDTDAEVDPLCDEDSHMKLIWWGDVSRREDAGELLDMVDQIHEYAVTTHRPFVANHLDAWEAFIQVNRYLRHYELPHLSPPPASLQELDWHSIKSNGSEVRKLLRHKRKRGALLTDDDERRSRLEARLKEWIFGEFSQNWLK
ncbi:hypothetical protein BDV41DRAFT_536195 [Aspergillus transmontanensis]|uniref:PD-(D/E)XK nuclease-like domain-containing protein n=1 Tax=Aspergillus transmontanensis TaxID=1034304 RepID=A0A5N6VY28_9EURO|nr:hypothetical protein BDV41DRAFT_536195 [Aspergillus transmontanensis]